MHYLTWPLMFIRKRVPARRPTLACRSGRNACFIGQVGLLAFAAAILMLCASESFHGAGFRVDTEDELQGKIGRENDPVKKAKLKVRLARLKLIRGEDACEKDNDDLCHQMMNSYLELVRDSWKDLEASGHRASRQPSGFKELDIALREEARDMEDAEHKVPFEDRDFIESVIKEINLLHEKVITALFPSGNPRSKEKNPPPAGKPSPEAKPAPDSKMAGPGDSSAAKR